VPDHVAEFGGEIRKEGEGTESDSCVGISRSGSVERRFLRRVILIEMVDEYLIILLMSLVERFENRGFSWSLLSLKLITTIA
jgi:hypothetical protein